MRMLYDFWLVMVVFLINALMILDLLLNYSNNSLYPNEFLIPIVFIISLFTLGMFFISGSSIKYIFYKVIIFIAEVSTLLIAIAIISFSGIACIDSPGCIDFRNNIPYYASFAILILLSLGEVIGLIKYRKT